MGWCGAETTFPFSNREDYDSARAALEELAVGHERANALPSSYGDVADLYFIDAKDRDALIGLWSGRLHPTILD